MNWPEAVFWSILAICTTIAVLTLWISEKIK